MFSIYWISTSLIALMLVLSASSYVFSQSTIEGIRALGFPDHFRIMLAALKFIAAVVLLLPGIPMMAKEWAYAGVALFILTAFVAHYAHKDPIWLNLINVVFFIVLAVSRFYYPKTLL